MEVHGTVRDILRGKGADVFTTTPDATVYEAVGLMGEKNIGALVVTEGAGVVGVITERDYSRKVVLRGRTSRDTKVADILSSPAITVAESDSIGHCMEIMTNRRIRHLPVLDADGSLHGLVSMGDLVNWVITSQRQTIEQLHGYIAGSYPG